LSSRIYRPVKRIGMAILLIIVLAGGMLIGGALRGYDLWSTALNARRQRTDDTTHLSEFALKQQMHQMHAASQINGWLSFVQVQPVEIDVNAQRRCAWIYEPVRAKESAPWALVLHGGIGTDHTQVLDVACELSLAGYRVLAPDLAAHGLSEGTWTSLGLREQQDVWAWVEWIEQKDPLAEIVIFGQDEGAAAALLAASAGLDESVRAIVADSLYLHVEERCMQMLEETQNTVSVLDRMLFRAACIFAFGALQEGDLLQAIGRSTVPILLAYGSGDEDTPAWYGEEFIKSAGENVRLLMIEGAVHGMARYGDPQAYYDAVITHFEAALAKK